MTLRCLLPLSGLLFLTSIATTSAAPRAELIRPAVAWQLVELTVQGLPSASNPFDPESIRVDAEITGPSGDSVVLPAFWYQAFERERLAGAEVLTAAGQPHWRIRFRPTEAGAHVLIVRSSGGTPGQTLASAPLKIEVAPAAPDGARGWVRVAPDARTFATSAGEPLPLTGHNVCWPGAAGTYDYDDYFARMAATGHNFARLWLAPWWAPLEHVPGTLTNYRLDAAWQLDYVFAAAERHGIYLLLCLDHHGMYQPVDPTWGGSNAFWTRNPYSREQGGPCAQPREFFELPAAKAAYQKRLRYLIGRYSHSRWLHSWQFFNEIDNVFDRAPVDEATVVAWHVEMARWLRQNDPYRHVISTSLTGGVDRPAFWQQPELEYTSYHAYWDPAPARTVGALMRDFVERYGKPALVGEFGISGASWEPALDPHLRGFRQHLWGGTLGGAASTPLSWWWEDLHRDGALGLEAVLVNFLRQHGWGTGDWTPARFATSLSRPFELGPPSTDMAPFNAELALNSFRRLQLDGRFALTDAFSARRSSEHLSAVLWGQKDPQFQRPLRLKLWTGSDGRVSIGVASVNGPAELVARLNGREAWRQAWDSATPEAQTFALPLPAGQHEVELLNVGADRLTLAHVRAENVRPAALVPHWEYSPEPIGLRREREALIYVVAPAAVYPAGAIRYELDNVRDATIELVDWRPGTYRVQWIDPESGDGVEQTTATSTEGRLTLRVPVFQVDLAAYIGPLN